MRHDTMKYFGLAIWISGLLLCACNQNDKKASSASEANATNATGDKEQIQNLIREMLVWSDAANSIDLLPVIADDQDSVYIGFDLQKHRENLAKLRQTNIFSAAFVDNYNQIIMVLDEGLKKGRYGTWLVDDLHPFAFSNGYSPWCNCQDIGDWRKVEVRVIRLTDSEGELEWFWGDHNAGAGNRFRAVKENGKWKVAYLSGFDFNEATRKIE
ncbi:MAG: hypothetical protein ACK4NS_07355 [Saprospiraceae bacterium]